MYVNSETLFSQISLSCPGVNQGWGFKASMLAPFVVRMLVSSQWWKGEDQRGAAGPSAANSPFSWRSDAESGESHSSLISPD